MGCPVRYKETCSLIGGTTCWVTRFKRRWTARVAEDGCYSTGINSAFLPYEAKNLADGVSQLRNYLVPNIVPGTVTYVLRCKYLP